MEKLIIADKVKKTTIYINNILDNFPKKHIELKTNISKSLYELLELVYLANINIDRENNKKKCIVKLELIDFYIMIMYKNMIISKKKYEGISLHLLEIKKMLYGWINEKNRQLI